LIAPEPPSTSSIGPGLGRVDAVEQPAHHVGPPDVALLEGHQHLVADLGQHEEPAVLAGAACTVRAQSLT
jgi:hypothetical protein